VLKFKKINIYTCAVLFFFTFETLALVLVGTFAFANNDVVNTINMEDNYHWVDVLLPCGITGVVLYEDGDTLEDINDMANFMAEDLC